MNSSVPEEFRKLLPSQLPKRAKSSSKAVVFGGGAAAARVTDTPAKRAVSGLKGRAEKSGFASSASWSAGAKEEERKGNGYVGHRDGDGEGDEEGG